MAKLPEFIPPMLATVGAPFDSPEYSFEIKWDGTRAAAYVENGSVRLMNRRQADITHRYPELSALGRLPAGTVLDGEIVILRDGMPDFEGLLSREQAQSGLKIRSGAKASPATYVAFDQLYRGYESVCPMALDERREMLRQTVSPRQSEQLVVSEGTVGEGIAYFGRVIEGKLEGIIAKRLNSRYRPGKRTDDWQKIKPQLTLVAAVIGYLPSPERKGDFKSLIIAAEVRGNLVCVGKVGSGFDAETREKALAYLNAHRRTTSVTACTEKGKWVEPGLYCTVAYFEWTKTSQLRAPVFKGFYSG
jgi:bifunctional non-homologous end joining protein LigD